MLSWHTVMFEKESRMNCKHCGCSIERAIEGELICERDWARSQQLVEIIALEEDIAWFENHCADCEKAFSPALLERHQGFCPNCLAEMNASLA
jgi:hypothetical protein